MSDLTNIEKLKLKKLLVMNRGCVLDFSEFDFQEFILQRLSIDIYDEKYSYRAGSNAKRLRRFWAVEPNPIVGELIERLLEYWRAKSLINKKAITPEDEILFNECQKIVKRLRGDIERTKIEEIKEQEKFSLARSKILIEFDKFASMEKVGDKKQRGFLLEDLLNRIFSLHEIPARMSFERNEGGDQIDGSFELDGWYCLVECIWTQNLTDIRQLDSLYGDINRSGWLTIGLFLSINGWSKNVASLLKQKNYQSIILMDGHDLRAVLVEHNNLHLKDLLLKKLERLMLDGEPFYSATLLLQDV
ncbi:hypothetical protein H6F90_24270 [Trichocoleus sp. FACHB-591]|uniref:hypothetical protein n=1 Tax=Trichocoleus sp. FACHB-591 TaxID=2692872 RepID=UPI0016852E49|nr:hypothetical protein [Trichocoleus sp. FACHB-591]MBD2098188.1 hypothetical protein [Trichocoleus sp. FACHB-591]